MNTLNKKFFKNNSKLTSLLALALLVVAGLACGGGEKAELPNDTEIQSLLKKTASDFAAAVEKEDFSDFMKTTSGDFQKQFDNQKMKTGFASFIEKKDQVVPILQQASTANAQFSPAPSLKDENGFTVLETKGKYALEPYPVEFENSYVRENGAWKLIRVKYKM